jgi:hypothetical protein
VHDRTLFGFNGQHDGIVSKVHELDELRRDKNQNGFLIKLTLLAVVLEGVAQLAIAAWK